MQKTSRLLRRGITILFRTGDNRLSIAGLKGSEVAYGGLGSRPSDFFQRRTFGRRGGTILPLLGGRFRFDWAFGLLAQKLIWFELRAAA
jgi:hypothetical protein